MIKPFISAAFAVLLFCFSSFGETGTAEFSAVCPRGEFTETITGEYTPGSRLQPLYEPPEVLWHYSLQTGAQQKMAPIGFGAQYVFTGGWYGGAQMFQGSTGDGTVLWSYEPQEGWTGLGTSTAAARSADVFYAVQNWDNARGANTAVHCFAGGSETPVWSYDAGGTFDSGSVDGPGKFACAADGSVLAVGGAMGGHLAILFFSPDSATPIAVYEDPSLAYYPRQLRITEDGSKCIFRVSATLYRVDTATGTLEASMALDASNDCFGVSPDGSVVAYGFTAARVAVWDGSEYSLVGGMAVTGYYGGAAAVAADNSTVYFGFYRNDYRTNRIIRYDLDTMSPLWTYDYPVGSGAHQDVMEWMECSADGRWMVAGSWGCQTGGGAEVNVFDDLAPEAPVFSINTPGSVFHVDISSDGRYITSAGKHVHANQMGSGTDVYMAEIDVMGTEGSPPEPSGFSISPNPAGRSFGILYTAAEPCGASLVIYDLGGRLVHRETFSASAPGRNTLQVTTGLPAGVYTCVLKTPLEEAAARLVVTR